MPAATLMRYAIQDARGRIHAAVRDAGFDDVGSPHITLFRWPGPEGRRPTEVAADAQISKQRVNDLLGDLERLGYLERTVDPTDERARIVRLTERGQRLQEAALASHRAVEREWADAVGPERWEQLLEALAAIAPVGRTAGP